MSKKCGSIKLIIGCMFSGKTTELQREFREWASIGKKTICINHQDDNRYGDIYTNMYSHSMSFIECVKTKNLFDISREKLSSCNVILVNEGQFFPDVVDFCKYWAERESKNVIVCGLDGDFKREPFGNFLNLVPLADEIVKLNAYCKNCSDGTKALFTHRKTSEKEQIVIGSDNYEALCRNCYLLKNNS